MYCRICDATPTSAFRWSYVLDNSLLDPEDEAMKRLRIGRTFYRAIVDTVRHRTALKSGQLYQCPFCDQFWCLYADFLHRLSDDQASLIHRWNSEPQPVSDAIRTTLSVIGGIASSRWDPGSGVDQIVVPARVLLASTLEVETTRVFVSARLQFSIPLGQ